MISMFAALALAANLHAAEATQTQLLLGLLWSHQRPLSEAVMDCAQRAFDQEQDSTRVGDYVGYVKQSDGKFYIRCGATGRTTPILTREELEGVGFIIGADGEIGVRGCYESSAASNDCDVQHSILNAVWAAAYYMRAVQYGESAKIILNADVEADRQDAAETHLTVAAAKLSLADVEKLSPAGQKLLSIFEARSSNESVRKFVENCDASFENHQFGKCKLNIRIGETDTDPGIWVSLPEHYKLLLAPIESLTKAGFVIASNKELGLTNGEGNAEKDMDKAFQKFILAQRVKLGREKLDRLRDALAADSEDLHERADHVQRLFERGNFWSTNEQTYKK